MTPEEIVESILTLAEEASHKKLTFGVIVNMATGETRDVQAEMVSWVRTAIDEERAACARIVIEQMDSHAEFPSRLGERVKRRAFNTALAEIAAAIRARSSEPKATVP